jgi:hypothetical protein
VTIGKDSTKVRFDSGVHVLFVPVDGLFGAIAIRRTDPDATVCVTNVLVGEPVV